MSRNHSRLHRLSAQGAWWFTFLIMLASAPLAGATEPDDPFDLIVNRQRDALLAGSGGNLSTALWWAGQLNAAGSWNDINYAHGGQSTWHPEQHTQRLQTMALAQARLETPNAELQEAIERSLGWWLDNDPQADNWWFNQIGTPTSLMYTMSLVGHTLPENLFNGTIQRMRRAQVSPGDFTGANAVSSRRVVLVRAALERDPVLLDIQAKAVAAGIEITPGLGVQADYSFHYHGAQLYNGGYGAEYINNITSLAQLVHDTPYQVNDEKLDILVDYMVEGQQWMMRNGWMTYSASGRGGYARLGGGTRNFTSTSNRLAELRPERADELQLFIDRQNGNAAPLEGFRHFWRSDMSVHHGPAHMMSIKMYSTRVQSTGMGNGENLKATHVDHGMTLIFRDGSEYNDIFPAWDWKHVPGTTAAHDGRLLMRSWGGPFGETDFVGGAGDGERGVTAFDFRYTPPTTSDTLEARKAWFAFDDAIVALGTGVAGGGDHEVTTTLNQSLRRGSVVVGGPSGLQTFSSASDTVRDLSGSHWVHHDGIGYVMLDDDKGLLFRGGNQQGLRQEVNNNFSGTVNRDVFRLWVSHGEAPEDGSYGYVILPGASAAETHTFSSQSPLRVLANEWARQAVYHTEQDVLQVAFYEAGLLSLSDLGGDWSYLSVDQPLLVMVDASGDDPLLTVSDPTQTLEQATVDLNGILFTIDLPTGLDAGGSVVTIIPEPGTLSLLTSLAALGMLRRRRRVG